MPSPRADARTPGKVSFHGRGSSPSDPILRRPRTLPDLKAWERTAIDTPKKLTKVLLNVTVQGSVGVLQVLISPELTVGDLISAAFNQYLKEGRRPVLVGSRLEHFDLHYSQFTLQSLDREEKLAGLGSRNFFLCRRKEVVDSGVPVTSCSTQADKITKLNSCPWPWPWFKFMSFLF